MINKNNRKVDECGRPIDVIDFNLNQHVYVQLTDVGRRKLRSDYYSNDDVNKHLSAYKPPEEDEDGWSRWQMHDLIEKFGGQFYFNFDFPYSLTIKLEVPVEKLRESRNEKT